MTSTQLYLLIGTFILITIIFKLLITSIINKGKYEKRLKKYVVITPVQKKDEKREKQKSPLLTNVSKAIESAFHLKKHQQVLIQSGVELTVGELFIGRLVVALLLITIGYFYGLHVVWLILIGIIGYQLPLFYIRNKRKVRLAKCSEQLGEALGTMANALRAGFSFMQAMQMVAKEIEAPLGPEFLKALQEINYGVSVEDAFERLLERLPDKELEIVLNTLIIQRSSGGNLAFLLETMQETIIDRSRVKGEVKSLTAQGKMSSVIITLLPIALAFYVQLVNPEYFQMLFSHPLGWAMVIFGSINIILGWLFIRKIVQIEV
ncbi:type II secretion system F family protein [Oceanobacillus saliphilus]|uniref:type II secretion system F family protein n=1 Tax=Oceanobacillus saliphilus TaxID=2925834 RepID=UPI00201DEBE1|nr:type II secretion system F family protein [Oceanobacillus saliphilus]